MRGARDASPDTDHPAQDRFRAGEANLADRADTARLVIRLGGAEGEYPQPVPVQNMSRQVDPQRGRCLGGYRREFLEVPTGLLYRLLAVRRTRDVREQGPVIAE